MPTALSIKYAKDCAYAGGDNFVMGLDDPIQKGDLVLSDGTRIPQATTGFDNGGNGITIGTHSFYGKSSFGPKSRMGYIIEGTGRRRGELLITFRGSQKTSDYVLIDAAGAPGTSPKGFAVHGGFAKVFQSCLPDISDILFNYFGRCHTIHCCGHSMGGALATLAAEHFINGPYTPYLYTFGAPRVGFMPHSQFMQKHMGDRINRYYYASDLVTWLPMMPYVHLPGKRLITTNSFIAGHNDYMKSNNLILAGGGNKLTSDDPWLEAEILINRGGSVGGGYGMTSRGWRWLSKAFHLILAAVGTALGLALVPSITILDQIVASISFFITRDPNRKPLIIKWIQGCFTNLCKFVSFGSNKIVSMLKYLAALMCNSIKNETDRELAAAQYYERQRRGRRPVIRFN
ncbi:lipase family protein [Ningiella sp. W23]|uniref:lipase family protein n=1 Tax=Ningiella sp. W23 TaxID=3023715 RepID=UPI0037576BD3